MRNREIELFNLSFLDILSGALGAILFLFIVVPKGGKPAQLNPPLAITIDTVQGKFFGVLPDSLWDATAGDSILSIVVDYKRMPELKDCPPQRRCPDCPKVQHPSKGKEGKPSSNASPSKLDTPTKSESTPSNPSAAVTSNQVTQPKEEPSKPSTKYKGDLPSVPCQFSVEIKWTDITNNVDLYLCKDGQCVYGARRKNAAIGFWDSGKSKTSLFGGDLRTTQEAVRQFDAIIPGTYNIYAQFKSSQTNLAAIRVDGLVYTNTSENGEKGETFIVELPISQGDRTLIGKLNVNENGSFTFEKQF